MIDQPERILLALAHHQPDQRFFPMWFHLPISQSSMWDRDILSIRTSNIYSNWAIRELGQVSHPNNQLDHPKTSKTVVAKAVSQLFLWISPHWRWQRQPRRLHVRLVPWDVPAWEASAQMEVWMGKHEHFKWKYVWDWLFWTSFIYIFSIEMKVLMGTWFIINWWMLTGT